MKAEIVIKQVRDDMQMMWNKHLLYIETKGAEGIPCLDVPSMKEYMNRTDEEILRDVESKGFIIFDKEEYLSKIKRAK